MKQTLLLLSLLLFVGVHSTAAAQTTHRIEFEPSVHGLMKIHATVAGHQGTFLFDSGSGVTSLSPEFASLVGCNAWGQITGFRMTGERLDMQRCDHVAFSAAGWTSRGKTVGVFDVSQYLPPDVGPIDGTLALDIFADETVTLSYGERWLDVLGAAAKSRLLKRPSFPVQLVRDASGFALAVDLPVKTSAGTTWFEMDSGNTGPFVIVNKTIAPLFELSRETNRSPVALSVGDGSSFQGAARVLALILDGNLGSSFLGTHKVTVDLLHSAGWIE